MLRFDPSNAGDLADSSHPVLTAHIEIQNYSPLLEVCILCEFKFSHITAALEDQRLVPHGEAPRDL